ncbi:MAG: hypothetical protein JXR94_24045, partial [Candidatus Hydrogenedentes bacterium]|nr:hypothetical protein [Candidatus Hydrogenedentota bacterium]
MVDCHFFGLDPRWHHASSLFLHVCNAVALYLILTRFTGARLESAIAAALFAVHPVNTEAVAWIAARKDPLCTFLALLATACYGAYAARPGRLRYLAVLTVYCLALMAKPMAIALPAAFLLLDYWPLGRWRASGERGPSAVRLIIEKVPLFVAALACVLIAAITQSIAGALGSAQDYPLGIRIANAAVSYVAYLRNVLWPAGLAVYYPHPGSGLAWWKAVAAGTALVGATGAAWALRRRCPYLFTGWFWYLVMLFPVSGAAVQLGSHAMADRYGYLPLIGVFVAAAWALVALAARWGRPRAVLVPAAVLVAACVAGANLQVRHWRNSEALFTHALAVTPANPVAHNNLGEFYLEQHDW